MVYGRNLDIHLLVKEKLEDTFSQLINSIGK